MSLTDHEDNDCCDSLVVIQHVQVDQFACIRDLKRNRSLLFQFLELKPPNIIFAELLADLLGILYTQVWATSVAVLSSQLSILHSVPPTLLQTVHVYSPPNRVHKALLNVRTFTVALHDHAQCTWM